jgi:hypothetical protein
MRRALIGGTAAVATLTAVVATALPAVAATRVDGTHFAQAGVQIYRSGCDNAAYEPPSQPRLAIRRGPDKAPLGTRSVGWTMDGADYGVGPVVHVDAPSRLTVLDISVKAPSGYAQGRAVVVLHPTGDTGYWRGVSSTFTETTDAWHVIQAASHGFAWTHYTADGTLDENGGSALLPAFVAAHGGDGDGAEVGYMFGCDGSAFFVDALTVGNADGSQVWNFEGAATRTSLKTRGFRTITYGEKVGLGSGVERVVGDTPAAGKLLLRSRADGQRRFRQSGAEMLDDRGRAGFTVSPAHTTTYRARYLGTNAVEASSSRTVRVKVATRVKAALLDARIVKGRAFTIAGRTLPRKAHTRIRLQRYDGKDWSTVGLGLTGADGAFRIGTRIARLGRSYWRVVVVKASGNEAGKSRWMKVKVVAPPPPPPPHGGGGGGTPQPPPPTQPPTNPPPPPPDGPQRPRA